MLRWLGLSITLTVLACGDPEPRGTDLGPDQGLVDGALPDNGPVDADIADVEVSDRGAPDATVSDGMVDLDAGDAAPPDGAPPVLCSEGTTREEEGLVCTCRDGDWTCVPTCRIVSETVDQDGDGAGDDFTVYTYDEALRLVNKTFERDGVVEREYRYFYTFDGLLQQEEERNGQGQVRQRTTYRYDQERRLSRKSIDRTSGGNIPTLASEQRFTYHDDGYLASMAEDQNGDGDLDTWTYYRADGEMTGMEGDADRDGEVDYRVEVTFDEAGRRVRVAFFQGDRETPLTTDLYTYDAQGNNIEYARDRDGDEMVDYRLTRTFDAEGRLTRFERDDDADDDIEQSVSYTYDEAGRLVLEETQNLVQMQTRLETRRYDGAGNPVAIERDDRADGILDRQRHSVYDSAGNHVETLSDNNGNGFADRVQRLTYDCRPHPAECDDDDQCVAEDGCTAECTEWNRCAQRCNAPLPLTPPGCEDARRTGVVGEPCRPCGGVYEDAGPQCEDLVVCTGGHDRNVCGGCTDIPRIVPGNHFPQDPGGNCGEGHFYYCATRDHLSCTTDEVARNNRCLADDDVEQRPGGSCEGGPFCRYACERNEADDGLACVCD